jgi:Base plate wedge protein 53
MALDNFSRFKNTERVINDGHETFGRWVPPLFISNRPDEHLIGVYKVTSQTEGRPDLIAHAIYGNSEFYWVLLAFNKVYDTLNWPRAGDLIEYPLDTVVLSELF